VGGVRQRWGARSSAVALFKRHEILAPWAWDAECGEGREGCGTVEREGVDGAAYRTFEVPAFNSLVFSKFLFLYLRGCVGILINIDSVRVLHSRLTC
jgi:hypothetical protein